MRLFRTAGRFFQLMVFFGDRHPSRADFALANRALRGLRIVPQR